MSALEIPEILAASQIFVGLGTAPLAAICAGAKERYFAKDRFMFKQGGAALEFFLIRQGRVALEVARPGLGPITLQTLGPGDVLGWSWLVSPYTWHFDARALDEVATVALDAPALRAVMDRDTALGYALARRFLAVTTERLQAARIQLMDVYARAHV